MSQVNVGSQIQAGGQDNVYWWKLNADYKQSTGYSLVPGMGLYMRYLGDLNGKGKGWNIAL